jgi:hypothetical protein
MSSKGKQQVNDDDVRNQLTTKPQFVQDDWYFTQDQINMVFKMHMVADSKDQRRQNLRKFCVWMMQQCDDGFSVFHLFGDYFDSADKFQILKLTWIDDFKYVLDEMLQMEVSPSS